MKSVLEALRFSALRARSEHQVLLLDAAHKVEQLVGAGQYDTARAKVRAGTCCPCPL